MESGPGQRQDSLARLRLVGVGLREASGPSGVLDVVAAHGIEGISPLGGLLAVLDRRGRLRRVASRGYPEHIFESWPLAVTAGWPLSEAVRLGEPVWLSSKSDRDRRFPAIADIDSPAESQAFLPLVAAGKTLGALGLAFAEPHEFTEAEQLYLLAVADQCALWLQQAQLIDELERLRVETEARTKLEREAGDERAARQAAELAQDRLAFLARASDILFGSTDYEATLKELAGLIVPQLADWCSVDLVERGEIRNVAVAHVDPAKVELAEELQRRYPADPNAATGVANVVRTGRPELYAAIPDELLEPAAVDEEHLEILRNLGLRSAMVLPLTARGRSFGAITLVTAESGRTYGAPDLALGEDLAARAALALDNTMLLRAERMAAHRAQILSRVSESLSRSLDYARVFAELAELVVEEIADMCMIDVMDEDTGALRRVAARHRDPEKAHVMRVLLERPPDVGSSNPAATAFRTRRPTFEREMSPEAIEAIARDEQHEWVIAQTVPRSFICVPLVARGEALGVLSIVSTDPARSYSEQDVEFASELASRAAIALDNARLFDAQVRAATQARRLQSIVDAAFRVPSTLNDLLLDLLGRVVAELGTNIAVILLREADDPTLRVAAAIGLEEEVAAHVRVPIGHGFAGRVAERREAWVVEDLSSIEVVSAYMRERVASIMGVPLVVAGDVIGVLHASTTTPRTFEKEDVVLLQLAAERAAVAVRNAQLYEREHRTASVLQETLLPAELPTVPGLEIAARFFAAGEGIEVGGDFYDVFALGPDEWAVAVGDVCGRGPEAARVTALARYSIRAFALLGHPPSTVLGLLNDTMLRQSVDRFCTLVLARVRASKEGVRLTVGRAGHPPPLVLRGDGSLETIPADGALLGVFEQLRFVEAEIELDPGEVVLFFTDGLVERSPGIRDREGLSEILAGCVGLSAEDIARRIEEALRSGDEPTDDVAMIVLRAGTLTP